MTETPPGPSGSAAPLTYLLVHQAFVLPGHGGGTRHFEFARLLGERGHRSRIVASSVSYLSGASVSDEPEAELPAGVTLERVPALTGIHTSYLWRILGFLVFSARSFWAALRAPGVDVYWATTPPIFQAPSAILAAKLRGKPVLLEVRDLWPDFAVEMGILRSPLLIWLAQLLEATLYWSADRILVNSPAYRHRLAEKGVDPERIDLIPNGVDTSMFDLAEDRADLRRAFGWGDDFVAVYAGALGPANDIDTILDATACLGNDSEVRIVLIGGGKDRARIADRIRAEGLARVELVETLPKPEVIRRMVAADAGLATLRDIPGFRTTYPNKVFDYMAARIPTLLTIDGVIREVVEQAEAGVFLPPEDAIQLAEGLRRCSADRQACRQMGARGRRYVEQHFERARHAETLEAILLELRGGHAGGGRR